MLHVAFLFRFHHFIKLNLLVFRSFIGLVWWSVLFFIRIHQSQVPTWIQIVHMWTYNVFVQLSYENNTQKPIEQLLKSLYILQAQCSFFPTNIIFTPLKGKTPTENQSDVYKIKCNRSNPIKCYISETTQYFKKTPRTTPEIIIKYSQNSFNIIFPI